MHGNIPAGPSLRRDSRFQRNHKWVLPFYDQRREQFGWPGLSNSVRMRLEALLSAWDARRADQAGKDKADRARSQRYHRRHEFAEARERAKRRASADEEYGAAVELETAAAPVLVIAVAHESIAFAA
jgi:hypothetical protein